MERGSRQGMSDMIKVGVFMTVALVVVAYLILKAEDLRLFAPEGERMEAVFDTVAGLDDKAAVRMAGVRVGRVDGIRLEGGKARVQLLFERPVELTEGSRAVIANLGLLGDKYVELQPGPEDAPLLPPGAVLPGESPVTFDQVASRLTHLGDSLQLATGQLSGEEAEGPLADLIASLQATSDELRRLLDMNRAQVGATMHNLESVSGTLARELPRLTRQLDALLADVHAVVTENRGAIGTTIENVEQLTAKLQTGVDNLNEISGRLARGEGTVGKLLTSDEAHQELVATLEKVQEGVDTLSGTLGKVQKLQLNLGMESYYLDKPAESRSAFHLELDPQSGKRYRLEVVDSPYGRERTQSETRTVTHPDGTRETTVVDTVKVEDKLQFSALVGFDPDERFSLWAGVIESQGGVQVEFHPRDPRWWLSFEAFDFDRTDLDPHLRLKLGWALHRNFYLVGGYDDPLVSDRESLFLGGGIRWRDDDLKYLLGSVPRF